MLIDRAGVNLKDGATHHGIFDVAFLSHIPNVRMYTPISNAGLKASMDEALSLDCPCAIRYPSGIENTQAIQRFYKNDDFSDISLKTDFDKSEKDKLDAIIITHGRIVSEAIKTVETLKNEARIGIVLLEVLKPYEETARRIKKLFGDNLKAVLFYEEEIKNGGMGMTLSTILKDDLKERNIEYNILAINDNFAATSKEGQNAYQMAGVDCLYVERELRSMLDITPNNE